MSYSNPAEYNGYGFENPSILIGTIYLSFFYGIGLFVLGT